MPERRDVTQLLRQYREGDAAAGEHVLALLYDELHAAARRLMRGERDGHTLQPTALVHEAWLRMAPQDDAPTKDRDSFLGIAARVMRQVLVDHARTKAAHKRGGDREREPLDLALAALEQDDVDVLALNDALDRLARQDTQLARVVDLRFFAGLTLEETAAALDLSVKQVRRSWDLAQAWLHRDLK